MAQGFFLYIRNNALSFYTCSTQHAVHLLIIICLFHTQRYGRNESFPCTPVFPVTIADTPFELERMNRIVRFIVCAGFPPSEASIGHTDLIEQNFVAATFDRRKPTLACLDLDKLDLLPHFSAVSLRAISERRVSSQSLVLSARVSLLFDDLPGKLRGKLHHL
jgi:hypothetical protein